MSKRILQWPNRRPSGIFASQPTKFAMVASSAARSVAAESDAVHFKSTEALEKPLLEAVWARLQSRSLFVESAESEHLASYFSSGPQVIWSSSSASIENAFNEKRLLALQKVFTGDLLAALRREPIEGGIHGPADDLVEKAISDNRLATLAWLNTIFLENFKRPAVASDVLRLVGRLPFEIVNPTGPTMAVAGLANRSAMVQEAAVRAFERWVSLDSYRILIEVHATQAWLQEYIDAVKLDLKKQLCLE